MQSNGAPKSALLSADFEGVGGTGKMNDASRRSADDSSMNDTAAGTITTTSMGEELGPGGIDLIDSPLSPSSLNPVIINHKDESVSNYSSSNAGINPAKLTTVVKIVNPPHITIFEASPPNNPNSTNNITGATTKTSATQRQINNTTNNSTLTNVSQIARIHSNGSSAAPPRQQQQQHQNFSMTSSVISSSSLPPSALPPQSNQPNNNITSSTNSSSMTSSSVNNSIAVIDVKAIPGNGRQLTAPTTMVTQPGRMMNSYPAGNANTTTVAVDDDGVRYKFVSNQTIGAKSSQHNEFDDINMDSMSDTGKTNGCGKCLRCCTIM